MTDTATIETCIQDSEAKFNKNFLEFILAQNKGLQDPAFENGRAAFGRLRLLVLSAFVVLKVFRVRRLQSRTMRPHRLFEG